MGLKCFEKGKKFHFIGIGGVSMSALAAFLSDHGYTVTGSDGAAGELVEKLRLRGIAITIGIERNEQGVSDADAVVYTDAVAETDQELTSARRLEKTVFSRGELLRLITQEFSCSLAVAGSHGKTTCTAMCAHIFRAARVPFTAFIGGEDAELSNYRSTGEEYLVTEACEYKKNLLKIPAKTRIVLNIDSDHMDCYRDFSDLKNTFHEFAVGGETAVVCADDENLAEVPYAVTFGIENGDADYLAKNIRSEKERYSFTVYEFGKRLCRIRLKAVGKCHIYNALAAFAATRSFGFSAEEIKRGLESFTAVKRRFEVIGKIFGALAVCDYAHHPKEIASTLQTAEKICDGNLFVVFQPHTYSRTKSLLDGFVQVFRGVKRLMIYKTYPAREKYDGAGSAARLAEAVGNCLYAESVTSLSVWLKRTVKENDCVLFLGAGDIYYLAKYLVNDLKTR